MIMTMIKMITLMVLLNKQFNFNIAENCSQVKVRYAVNKKNPKAFIGEEKNLQ